MCISALTKVSDQLDKMQLCFRGSTTHVLECLENIKIVQIKDLVAALEGLTIESMLLYAEGKPVADESVVSNFRNVEIEMNMRLPGGKVHGSLARAGKVKSQTPKVEKQEKKKKKTGRAKKRQQYNKRILNAPKNSGCNPRGPNSSADRKLA